MSFSEILKEMVSRSEALGGVISGMDGIVVEEYAVQPEADLQSLGAEASSMVKALEEIAASLDLGTTKEVTLQTDRATILLRRINPEYFLALLLRPNGNLGKGRFLLKRASYQLEREF